jgi:hypothetical protein
MREPTDGEENRDVFCRISHLHVPAVGRIPHDKGHDSSLVLAAGGGREVVS